MKLIDADALINEIKKETERVIGQDDGVGAFWLGYFAGLVLEQPTVTERTGHWIKISPAGIYECSKCGKNVMTSDIDAYGFCHGCGAHMIEEDK